MKKLNRLDKIFPKYVPNYQTSTTMEIEMETKQKTLKMEDEEK